MQHLPQKSFVTSCSFFLMLLWIHYYRYEYRLFDAYFRILGIFLVRLPRTLRKAVGVLVVFFYAYGTSWNTLHSRAMESPRKW
jgi:hypothetical protein